MHCRAGKTTDDMAHAQCVLDTLDYKCTHGLCDNYCFPIATMVARTILSVTLYVHCLSCLILSTVLELAILGVDVKMLNFTHNIGYTYTYYSSTGLFT